MKLAELRRTALELPESDRAALAADLLISLPADSSSEDEDEGVTEALCRSRELDSDPAKGCSWAEIKRSIGR